MSAGPIIVMPCQRVDLLEQASPPYALPDTRTGSQRTGIPLGNLQASSPHTKPRIPAPIMQPALSHASLRTSCEQAPRMHSLLHAQGASGQAGQDEAGAGKH